ncbi:MAG: hypothetical protein ABJA66_12920 [Actinomycetota bacterium]
MIKNRVYFENPAIFAAQTACVAGKCLSAIKIAFAIGENTFAYRENNNAY